MRLFRERLLDGRVVAIGGGDAPSIADALRALGARVEQLPGELDDEHAEQWARDRGVIDALVYDSRPAFGAGGLEGLRASADRAWVAVRGVAAGALIESQRGGKIVLLAPSLSAGPHASAARSALENLARTLSVEWARYAVSVTAIAPGSGTSEDQLATLVCFLASPAGDYYTGCRFELGAV
jgi:NAD(P)-dependent dehydrogenase (short-subunit alcohol dehydrogenase family)